MPVGKNVFLLGEKETLEKKTCSFPFQVLGLDIRICYGHLNDHEMTNTKKEKESECAEEDL